MSLNHPDAGPGNANRMLSSGVPRNAQTVFDRLVLAGYAAQVVGLAGMCVLLLLN